MIPHERSLVKKYDGEPFVLLGVNTDSDKEEYYQKAEEMGVTWRSAWQGSTGGPISRQYAVEGYPTLYLLDHEGRIVEDQSGVLRNPDALEAAIDKYVAIAKAASGETGDDLIWLPPDLLGDDDDEPVAETFESLEKQFNADFLAWRRAPRDDRGETPYLTYLSRFQELGDAGDGRSMAWVVKAYRSMRTPVEGSAEVTDRYAAALVDRHHDADWLAGFASLIAATRDLEGPRKVQLLRSWVEKGAHHSATGELRFYLGDQLARSEDEDDLAEALVVWSALAEDLPEDRYGQRAAGQVFKRMRLQQGMTVPDFETEDVDGVAFKLSDYRGKVVLIDFWGFW